MFYFFYNLTSVLLIVPVIIFNLYRSIRFGWPLALRERFGFVSAQHRVKIAGKPVIFIHAVSVGEIIAAKTLIQALRSRYPHHAIVVSNTTETGRRTATGFTDIDLCLYFPFDFLFSVKNLLEIINPAVIIIMETEIWPNFIREASRQRIPILLANGRISERSFKRYMKFRWFFAPALNFFSTLLMQSDANMERIVAIGAPAKRTLTAGNLKFDIPCCQILEHEIILLRKNYGIPENAFVITAGSTHDAEEEIIMDLFLELAESYKNLFLVLAPRHPQRVERIESVLQKKGISFKKLTESEALQYQKVNVLLVDTVGELLKLYSISDVAFVGGSLVAVGGHNLLEPASYGVPMVFGPYMSNFREVSELVLQYGAGVQVAGKDDLKEAIISFIKSLALRKVLGQNALKLMRDTGGATERHIKEIGRFL